jgi:NADH-quinone oxidoreductase subunit C
MTATDDAQHAGGWDDGTSLNRIQEAFPDLDVSSDRFRGELTLVVPPERIIDVLAFLRDDEACAFDFLTDVTAVHWPSRSLPFEVVYHLYSFPRNARLRIKCSVGKDPEVPSVVELWPTANWLERECYDMFGVIFTGHPNLTRILMTEDFEGWPLRKEFPLKV